MLQREVLHPKIADKVWMAFMRGEFDVAAFQAMKAVEVAVRDAADFQIVCLALSSCRPPLLPKMVP